jgi:hypothetical protein
MKFTKQILSLVAVFSLLLLANCGKRRSPQELNVILLSDASMTFDDLHKKYSQEIDLLKQEVDALKIKNMIGEIVGDKKFASNFAEKIFGTISADKIPFHKYTKTITSDIHTLKKYIIPLNKQKELPQFKATLDKIIDLNDDLYEIRSYVIKHREYRDEERYLTLCTGVHWI